MFQLKFKWRNPHSNVTLPELPPDDVITVMAPPRIGEVLSYGMCTYQVHDVIWYISSLKTPQGLSVVKVLVTVT